MVKESVYLSDWIQFFIHRKNLLSTLFGVLLPSLMVIIGYLMINIKDLTELNRNAL